MLGILRWLAAVVVVLGTGSIVVAAEGGEPASGQFAAGVKIGLVDLSIIVVYLVGIVALGCWAGLRRKSTEGQAYFLAGKSLTWPIIGLALFATNISTIHLVSLAQCGYTSGLLYGNFEWMAAFTLICLSLFFAPFYIRSKVATLPDFLEKRYGRSCRDWLAFLSIISAIFIHIGFSLYTGALVMNGLFGIDLHTSIIVVACLTGLYTIVGGLLAVVLTESIQTIILLVGAICITLIGLDKVGGWAEMKANVHPVNFSILRPDTDPTGLSVWAVFLGYPVIGLWYWCCDQTIVQRVLGAKDEVHARVGPLFAGFIKILPMFIFVMPGTICLALINKGVLTAPLEHSKDTYAYLINQILPVGLKGLVAAALLAALMSTVSGALNSTATLFSYDIYRRWRPGASDRSLVLTGRVVTFFAMLAAILWSPQLERFETVFQGVNDLICYISPPITVVFLWGVLWRKASKTAALITLLSGSVLGACVFAVDWFDLWGWDTHSMISGFGLFCIGSVTLVIFSYIFPHQHTEESAALVWKTPLDSLRGEAWPGLGNFRFLAALLLVVMVGFYWAFAGGESYYGVQGKVSLNASVDTRVVGARLVFECDDPYWNFTATTDENGEFAYPTAALAGGAPAGTHFRVKIVPEEDVTVEPHPDADWKTAPPTSLHSTYGNFDTSDLEITLKAGKNEFDLRLDPNTPPIIMLAPDDE